MQNHKNWHEKHKETLSFGSRIADSVAKGMGIIFGIFTKQVKLLLQSVNIYALWSRWQYVQFSPWYPPRGEKKLIMLLALIC